MGVLVCNDVLNGTFQTHNNPFSKVKKIRSLVKKAKEPASPEEIAKIKAKWMKCRNPDKTDEKLLVFVDDEDDTISVEGFEKSYLDFRLIKCDVTCFKIICVKIRA